MASNQENRPQTAPRDTPPERSQQSKFKNSPQRGTDEGRKSGGTAGSSAVPQDE